MIRSTLSGWARGPVRDQRGSLSVEAVIIIPGLVLMLGLMIAGGRLWLARTHLSEAAYSAARAASLARDPGLAETDGEQVARDELDSHGVRCQSTTVSVDTTAFAVPVGQPATVTSHLECRVGFGDLLLPGFPGSIDLSADGRSALDTYRQR
ncbi:Flp pilus assembly protein TadG [Friedmanniella endophytica]|uniref:Flp pilus assembly protein TadG n=1 Tax=Microlunatus kandeliicorticis TaxID=1759536 RepID=A0A7W3IQW0_9ACTN|nr:TadE/TadG family type IV pilus assembly protein [Microlunatus kandeliicorticis]MBA8793594.1 Flp pilus assembly protein TadG [Microlunatus kandeliicorticis]